MFSFILNKMLITYNERSFLLILIDSLLCKAKFEIPFANEVIYIDKCEDTITFTFKSVSLNETVGNITFADLLIKAIKFINYLLYLKIVQLIPIASVMKDWSDYSIKYEDIFFEKMAKQAPIFTIDFIMKHYQHISNNLDDINTLVRDLNLLNLFVLKYNDPVELSDSVVKLLYSKRFVKITSEQPPSYESFVLLEPVATSALNYAN
jgi:hypothetical protein